VAGDNVATRYYQIAVMIAEKIKNRTYPEGTKLNARSSLAVSFNTSPETVRRGLNVLADIGIVEMKHGSGAIVVSRKKAKEFLDNFNNIQTIQDSRTRIMESIKRQEEEISHFEKLLDDMFFSTQKAQDLYVFTPYELEIDSSCLCTGKSLNELNFWNRTEATIVGIKRGKETLISPGPYAEILDGDILYFVGDESAKQRVNNLLYGVEIEEETK
jgi:K+/H+ antiporter YhaU regulatory subunit KhtT